MKIIHKLLIISSLFSLMCALPLWSAAQQDGGAATGDISASVTDASSSFLGSSEAGADVSSNNTADMVNAFSGQAAFSLSLGGISNHNSLSYNLSLNYFGGNVKQVDNTHLKLAPTSWVGLGFSLETPVIKADKKGTPQLDDDEYYISGLGGDGRLIPAGAPASSVQTFVMASNPTVKVNMHFSEAYSETQGTYMDDFTLLPNTPLFPAPVTEHFDMGRAITFWEIIMPDGKVMVFGDPDENCGESAWEFCSPAYNGTIGYQPFYNLSEAAMVADRWYLHHIFGKGAGESRYGIFLEYHKERNTAIREAGTRSIQVALDQAIYLKRVYAVDGTDPATANTTSEILLIREPRPATDYSDGTERNPGQQFEKERLKYIRYVSGGKVVLQFELAYGQTANHRSRLQRIDKATFLNGNMADENFSELFAEFLYDGSQTWRIRQINDGAGVEKEFTYKNVPVPLAQGLEQGFNLNDIVLNTGKTILEAIEKPQVIYQGEFGDRYYLCIGPSNRLGYHYLIQFTNFGTYRKVTRVYKSKSKDSGGNLHYTRFAISPDGKYFAWAEENVHIYDLQKPDLPEDLIVYPKNSTLHNAKFGPELHVPNVNQDDEHFSVNLFNTWLAIADLRHDVPSRQIRFYGLQDGIWSAKTCGSEVGLPVQELKSGCVDFNAPSSSIFLQAQQGNNFLAVLNTKVTGMNNSMHFYSYENGQIRERNYSGGLVRSSWQLIAWNGNQSPIWDFNRGDGSENDAGSNIFYPEVTYFSVKGNLISLVIYSGANYYTLVFAWDGAQARYLHHQRYVYTMVGGQGPAVFTGPDYFILPAFNSALRKYCFDYYHVNQKNWTISGPHTLFTTDEDNFLQWGVKAEADYFMMEYMKDIASVGDAYRPAVTDDNGFDDYGRVYNVDPRLFKVLPNGEAPTELAGIARAFCNIQISGDRWLGIQAGDDEVNATFNYNYGRIGPDDVLAGYAAVDHPAAYAFMSAVHSSTGILKLGWTGAGYIGKLTGLLSFHNIPDETIPVSDYNIEVVDKIVTRFNGSGSSGKDLVAAEFLNPLLNDRFYNSNSRSPNFRKTVLTKPNKDGALPFYINGITSHFLFDSEESELSSEKKVLHGTPYRIVKVPGRATELSGTPKTGQIETVAELDVLEFSEALGRTLKEKIYLPIIRKSETKTFDGPSYVSDMVWMMGFDPVTGAPKVQLKKNGDDFVASLAVYKHEYDNDYNGPLNQIRQKSTYMLKGTDCTQGPEAPCGDLTRVILGTNENFKSRAVSSTYSVYDDNRNLDRFYTWHPTTIGTSVLTNMLTSEPSDAGNWKMGTDVLLRNDDIGSLAKIKHSVPVIAIKNDIYTTNFYGGSRGLLLGSVSNAHKDVCAILTGEEELPEAVTGLGAFGRWNEQGTASADIAHTGKKSIRVDGSLGNMVYVDLPIKDNSNFWDRKKGMIVSAWLYVPAGSAEPDARFVFKTTPSTTPIDLIAEYKAANGGALPKDRWVKLFRHVTWDNLNSKLPNEGDYIRVRLGKVGGIGDPIYYDDIRVYPADALAGTRNYDEFDRVTSVLDADNEPLFMHYDVWGGTDGVKDPKGLSFGSAASESFLENSAEGFAADFSWSFNGGNLVSNWSFENRSTELCADGLVSGSGPMEMITVCRYRPNEDITRSGHHIMHVTTMNAASSSSRSTPASELLRVEPNRDYELSVWVRMERPNPALNSSNYPVLKFLKGNGSSQIGMDVMGQSYELQLGTDSDVWKQYHWTFHSPDEATFFKLILLRSMKAVDNNGNIFLFDDLVIRKADADPAVHASRSYGNAGGRLDHSISSDGFMERVSFPEYDAYGRVVKQYIPLTRAFQDFGNPIIISDIDASPLTVDYQGLQSAYESVRQYAGLEQSGSLPAEFVLNVIVPEGGGLAPIGSRNARFKSVESADGVQIPLHLKGVIRNSAAFNNLITQGGSDPLPSSKGPYPGGFAGFTAALALQNPGVSNLYAETVYPGFGEGTLMQQSSIGNGYEIGSGHAARSAMAFITDDEIPGDPENPSNIASGEADYAYSWSRDPEGAYSLQFADNAGRVVKSISNRGLGTAADPYDWSVTNYSFDQWGRLETVTSPANIPTTYEYDGLNRVTKVIDIDRGNTRYLYNHQGQLRLTNTAAGREHKYLISTKYDKSGRIKGTAPVYAGSGELCATVSGCFIQANADDEDFPSDTYLETGIFYDELRSSVFQSITQVSLSSIDFSASALKNTRGKMAAAFNRNSKTESPGALDPDLRLAASFFSYNKDGQVEEVYKYNGAAPSGYRWHKIRYIYDDYHNLMATVYFKDKDEAAIASQSYFVYDDYRRVIAVYDGPVENPDSRILSSYYYNEKGQTQSVDMFGKVGVDYVYDLQGKVTKIDYNTLSASSVNLFTEYLGYETKPEVLGTAGGPPAGEPYAGRYDGRITSVVKKQSPDMAGNNPLEYRRFLYNADKTLWQSDVELSNNINSATGKISPPLSFQPSETVNYIFDEDGSFIEQTKTPVVGSEIKQSYNPVPGSHKLASAVINGQVRNVTYDDGGRIVAETGQLNRTISYNYGDMPSHLEVNGIKFHQFYDESGYRVAVHTDDGGTVIAKKAYVYEAGLKVAREIYRQTSSHPDGDKVIAKNYLYGRAGMLGIEDDATGHRKMVLKDHLGSSVKFVNVESNDLLDEFRYADYGKQDKTVDGQDEVVCSETWTGKEYEEDVMAYYFGARFYDADLGLWLSPDNYQEFYNPYARGGDPVNFVDPDGNCELICAAIIIGGAYIGGAIAQKWTSNSEVTLNPLEWKMDEWETYAGIAVGGLAGWGASAGMTAMGIQQSITFSVNGANVLSITGVSGGGLAVGGGVVGAGTSALGLYNNFFGEEQVEPVNDPFAGAYEKNSNKSKTAPDIEDVIVASGAADFSGIVSPRVNWDLFPYNMNVIGDKKNIVTYTTILSPGLDRKNPAHWAVLQDAGTPVKSDKKTIPGLKSPETGSRGGVNNGVAMGIQYLGDFLKSSLDPRYRYPGRVVLSETYADNKFATWKVEKYGQGILSFNEAIRIQAVHDRFWKRQYNMP